MRTKFISTVLALCLCISAIPGAYASQAYFPSETESTAVPVPYEDVNVPTYKEAYNAMAAMEAKYPEGMAWTDYTPYSDSNPYRWKGGPLNGQNIVAVGCAAFAFELSDTAFGSLPARMLSTGQFTFSDVKVGDILRVNNDAHTVIVLQVSDTGVVIAEGNNSGKVHWGRSLSKTEVEAASHYITRYPEGYVDPDDSTANDVIAQGTAGALTWTLTNAGTLTISGSGDMPDYSGPSEQPWNAHADKILKIVVENGVTSIGSSAFYNSRALSVTLPNSVTAIGSSAFYGSSLISVAIPGSVKTIGGSAFRSCPNLSSASISEGVETIDDNAFRGCQKLDSIALPASVGSVGAGAFYDCTELKSAAFAPGSKQVIMGDNLFGRCWKLNTVTLPQKMDRVSEGMFQNCYVALFSLSIPQGTDSIGASAFASCSSLTAITIPDSVTSIGTAAFSSCGALKDIYFGGSEAQWNSIGKTADINAALQNVTIHFNSSGTGTDPEGPAPGHTHSWAEAWSSDAAYHWHNCTASGCTVTGNSQKDGYAAHVYDSSTDAVCNVCGYTRTVNGNGSSSGNGSSFTTTTTVKNPDGSTTTRTENTGTGTIVETTKYKDGSQTVVETRTDGTVITAETDPDGNKTETVNQPDGSSVTTVSRKDGTVAAVTTSVSGQTEAKVTLPAAAVSEAQRSGEAIVLPIQEIQATQTAANAPAVTIKTDSAELVRVEIPTGNVTPGTVAVMVNADGSETVVKTSVPTERGVAVSLPDGATVKIVDNSKSFTDVSASHWASGAVAFVSARELFTGTTVSSFAPKAPMTRAMLMTVLARYDGEDTSGGAVWYEKGMDWAVANKISDGSNPDSNITREQFVTMLWRYSGSPASSGTLSAFTDADAINSYAQDAMRWATENGIINGLGDGRLNPGGQATRAEVAAMIMRYSLNA